MPLREAPQTYEGFVAVRKQELQELLSSGPLLNTYYIDLQNRINKATQVIRERGLQPDVLSQIIPEVEPSPWSYDDVDTIIRTLHFYAGDMKVEESNYDILEVLLQKSNSRVLTRDRSFRVLFPEFPLSMEFFLLPKNTQNRLVLKGIRKSNETLNDTELRLLNYLEIVDYQGAAAFRELPSGEPSLKRDLVLKSFQALQDLAVVVPYNLAIDEDTVSAHTDGDILGTGVPWSFEAVSMLTKKLADPMTGESEDVMKSPGEWIEENFNLELVVTPLALLLSNHYFLRYRNPESGGVIVLMGDSDRGGVLLETDIVLEVDLYADILSILPTGIDKETGQRITPQKAFRMIFQIAAPEGEPEAIIWKGQLWRQPEMPAPWFRISSSLGGTTKDNFQIDNAVSLVFSRDLNTTVRQRRSTQGLPNLYGFDIRNTSPFRIPTPAPQRIREGFTGSEVMEAFNSKSVLLMSLFETDATFLLKHPNIPEVEERLVLRNETYNKRFVALWFDDSGSQPVFLPSKLGWNRFWIMQVPIYSFDQIMFHNAMAGGWMYRTPGEIRTARPWAFGNIELELSPNYAVKVLLHHFRLLGQLVRTWMEVIVLHAQKIRSGTLSQQELDDVVDEALVHMQGIEEAFQVITETTKSVSSSKTAPVSTTLLRTLFMRAVTVKAENDWKLARQMTPIIDERLERLKRRVKEAPARVSEIDREMREFSPLFETSSLQRLKIEKQEAQALVNAYEDTIEDIHREFEETFLSDAERRRKKDAAIIQRFWRMIDSGKKTQFFAAELEEARGGVDRYSGEIVVIPQTEKWENRILTLLPAAGSVLPLEELTPVSVQYFLSGKKLAHALYTDLYYTYKTSQQLLSSDSTLSPEEKEKLQTNLFVVNKLTTGTGISLTALQHSKAKPLSSSSSSE